MDKIKARKSFGEDYECEYGWDCFVQCGDYRISPLSMKRFIKNE